MFGADPGLILVTKCLIWDSPLFFVGSFFVGGILFFGSIVLIAEAPISRISEVMDFSSFENSCWATVATMTTVGYGDMFPRTSLGRLIMIICSMYGVVVVSLIVVTVSNIL